MADHGLDEHLLRAVVETAVDGVILIDGRGTVLMYNPACERLFGHKAAEVIGRNVRMLMPPPYREEHDGYLDNHARTGERRIIGIGREVVGQRKDGSTFPMDLAVSETIRDGAPIFVGIIHDLTERHRSEEALRESAARIQAVLDTAIDGIILIDASGTVSMFNPACERLFGYAAAEVVGQNVKMLMPPPYREEHDGYLDNYARTGERKIIGIGREVVGQRKDGTTFPMDLSVGEVAHGGAPIFVGIIHDLSDRKQAEEQLVQAQKMEAVGQLSGGIAHDFNNLLTAIIGSAEFLSDGLKARPDLQKFAEVIITSGERGAELTRRLLAFSRRQVLEPVEIDCNRLVGGIVDMLRRMLRENIEIQASFHDDTWQAYADAAQMESALLNLALNAQDAMPEGGRITITTANLTLNEQYRDLHPEVRSGDYVMVAVTDTGHGMPPEVVERAFEPFFTTKEVGRGSGLGLSMVYGFVKQSEGHVSLYSEPSLGTTVRLYLPAILTDKGAFAATSPGDDGNLPTGTETVLVAEDDPLVRSYAVSCLESLGYSAVAAATGREALAHLVQGLKPDLLFTDIVMPGGMNGWQLAVQAQRLHPDLKLIFASGYALDTLSTGGHLPTGAVFLNKPYRKAVLAQRLRETLDRARPDERD